MSPVFAFVLAILAVGREVIEFFHFLPDFLSWLWHPFIFFLALLTIAAAIWEFFGNKLATSPQEVRFIAGTNKILSKIDNLQKDLDGIKPSQEQGEELELSEAQEKARKIFKTFLIDVLLTSSRILCGNHQVDVALMIYNKNDNKLILDHTLYQSPEKPKNKIFCFFQENKIVQFFNPFFLYIIKIIRFFRLKIIRFLRLRKLKNVPFFRFNKTKLTYPNNLEIPLGEDKDKTEVGPAETAFTIGKLTAQNDYVVHLPKKTLKLGIIFKAVEDEDYVDESHFEGWYPGKNEKYEEFRSVLSVPVTKYINGELETKGVLNFTTKKRDLFIDRDYIMANCFAKFIAHAINLYQKKMNDLKMESDI